MADGKWEWREDEGCWVMTEGGFEWEYRPSNEFADAPGPEDPWWDEMREAEKTWPQGEDWYQ